MDTEADWIHVVARVVEIVGIAIIVVGSFGARATLLFQMAGRAAACDVLVAAFRSNLGRSILLGLEFLVAADIVNTVAVEPTVQSLIVLRRHRADTHLPELSSGGRNRRALAVAKA